MIMNYSEWLSTVPSEIASDPIWKLEVYRLALFAGDIGWHDILALSKNNLMWGIADQLYRSPGSISANLTEGYSRSKGLDRARFFEIALGSARESRDWYYKSRHVLPDEVVKHRMELITRIISMLVPMISHQRKHAIREQQAEYDSSPQPSDLIIDPAIPFP
ncbi:MAG: four helix bundle protein [Anaerolineales bacterium]|nr:four helix bundle protein [Anaerolineales bacterium]